MVRDKKEKSIILENHNISEIKTLVNIKWLSVITVAIALIAIALFDINLSVPAMVCLFIVISAEYFIPEYLTAKCIKKLNFAKNDMETENIK